MSVQLTEGLIQSRLYWKFLSGSEIQAPNYTPRDWWECDLWRVTKSGYSYEYEIKLSVSDFRADKKKSRRIIENGRYFDQAKHEILSSKNDRGPSYFYFVLPDGIVEDSEVPEWAGIIRVGGNLHRHEITRNAPVRHRIKAKQETIDHARQCMSYRYWDLKNKIIREKEEEK